MRLLLLHQCQPCVMAFARMICTASNRRAVTRENVWSISRLICAAIAARHVSVCVCACVCACVYVFVFVCMCVRACVQEEAAPLH